MKHLQTRLEAEHFGKLQNQQRIRDAFKSVSEGLATLASLGSVFHLEPGLGEIIQEWPKMMFHQDKAANGKIILCSADASQLGSGWFDTLEAAQHWNGIEVQFRGRGGVRKEKALTVIGEAKDFSQNNVDIINSWKERLQNGSE